MKSAGSLLAVVVVIFLLPFRSVQAFNTDTHKAMNTTAARACDADFCLDTRLRDDLRLPLGIAEPLKGEGGTSREVIDWIGEGGVREDDENGSLLNSRSLQHFHDPLRPWDDAGLQWAWPLPIPPYPSGRFESSIGWMQEDDGTDAGANGAAQGWSWPDARRSYYHALTDQDPAVRERKWADTFRAVGQVVHLVEDTASPAHVRNQARRM